MPINESFQMQFTIGLGLAGYVPVSVYPRQNFLLLATADMVNMLDKMPLISGGQVADEGHYPGGHRPGCAGPSRASAYRQLCKGFP